MQKNVQRLRSLILSSEMMNKDKGLQNEIAQIQYVINSCQVPLRITLAGSPTQIMTDPHPLNRNRIIAAASDVFEKDNTEGEIQHMTWTKLPGHVAAQTFRDLVSREQYDYLYQPKDPNKYNLPKLKASLSRTVRNQGILAYQFVDHIDGISLEPGDKLVPEDLLYLNKRELKNPKVLRTRGIKVIAAGFPDLLPIDDTIRNKKINYWLAKFENLKNKISEDSISQYSQSRSNALYQIYQELAYINNQLSTNFSEDREMNQLLFQLLETLVDSYEVGDIHSQDLLETLKQFRNDIDDAKFE